MRQFHPYTFHDQWIGRGTQYSQTPVLGTRYSTRIRTSTFSTHGGGGAADGHHPVGHAVFGHLVDVLMHAGRRRVHAGAQLLKSPHHLTAHQRLGAPETGEGGHSVTQLLESPHHLTAHQRLGAPETGEGGHSVTQLLESPHHLTAHQRLGAPETDGKTSISELKRQGGQTRISTC